MILGTQVEDWIEGLQILSLDFARPIYRHLGVGVASEETLRGIVRDALLGRLSGEDRPFDIDRGQDPDRTYAVWVGPFVAALVRALGEPNRARVEHWVRYVNCSAGTRNPWVNYKTLLSSWASVVRMTGVDQIGLATDPGSIAGSLKSAGDCSDIKLALASEAVRPLSQWDFPFFEKMGLRDIPSGSDYFPFVDGIQLTVRMARFQGFWPQFLAAIESPDDVELIGSAVLELTKANNLAYCPPHDLLCPPLGL